MQHLAFPEAAIKSGQPSRPHTRAPTGIMYFTTGIVGVETWLSLQAPDNQSARGPIFPNSWHLAASCLLGY